MNIMNKLYKCALGLLTTFILSFASFSSALNVDGRFVSARFTNGEQVGPSAGMNFICFKTTDTSCTYLKLTEVNNSSNYTEGNPQNTMVCLKYNETSNITVNNNVSCLYSIIRMDLDSITEEYCTAMSSLECQTVYNLIPIEEVTANYCRLNFDLIDPQECPINSGTGAIVRSNLMINDIPYAQNQNINVFIPDFLNWNIAFNDFNTVIEVEGYNADEEYIENVINQEKLTPTNKDIEEMLTGFMTNYFPYLALAIIFLYLARKIFKLFK